MGIENVIYDYNKKLGSGAFLEVVKVYRSAALVSEFIYVDGLNLNLI